MSPAALALAQLLLQYGPEVAAKFVELWHKPDPTKDDFLAVLDAISKEDYDAIIAERRAARGLPPLPAPAP